MSLTVLVISENQSDWLILGPVIKRMFAELGKPNAFIRPCLKPKIGGVSNALKWETIKEVIDENHFIHVYLLVVDRDGIDGRKVALQRLEEQAAAYRPDKCILFGEHAWQEIEVWALAGQDLPKDWKWQEIREEPHPKERFFEPLAAQRGLLDEPGAGRTTMGKEAGNRYVDKVRQRCPEDIQRLEIRLKDWLAVS